MIYQSGINENFSTSPADWYKLEELLTITAQVIKVFGWVSRKEAYDIPSKIATSDVVTEILQDETHRNPDCCCFFYSLENKKQRESVDAKIGEEIVSWAKTLNPKNDYLRNLQTLANAEYIETKDFGFACSMVPAWQRQQEWERKHQEQINAAPSEWVGKLKQRLTFNVTIKSIKEIEGYYGVTDIHNMVDENGNVLVWFASVFSGVQEGDSVSLKGTIKKHDEFRGIKQTILNRCKVM